MSAVPSANKLIQIEETDFSSPGSEAMLQKIAGSQHYLIDSSDITAIGEIFESMLTEAELQAILGIGFILCDGRDVSGSRYTAITGESSIPDARGVFLREQQGSRNDTLGNPSGNLPIGQIQSDAVVAHTHDVSTGFNIMAFDSGSVAVGGPGNGRWINTPSNLTVDVVPSTGNETRPKCVTINYFIRIN